MSDGFVIRQDSLESIDSIALRDYKTRFAYAFLKNPSDPLKAGLEVFPIDKAAALRVSNLWPNDPEVILIQRELVAQNGEDEFLPSKNNFLDKIWDRLDKPCRNDDFVKLATLYANVRGFIPEKSAGVNVNIGDSAKVMVVTSAGSDSDWEKKLQQQQHNLLNPSNEY